MIQETHFQPRRAELDEHLLAQWTEDLDQGGNGPEMADEIRCRIQRFARQSIERPTHDKPHAGQTPWRIFEYVNGHATEVQSVSGIAGALHLHEKYILQVFKVQQRSNPHPLPQKRITGTRVTNEGLLPQSRLCLQPRREG